MKYVWIPPDYANHQLELPPSIAPNVHVHPRTSQPHTLGKTLTGRMLILSLFY